MAWFHALALAALLQGSVPPTTPGSPSGAEPKILNLPELVTSDDYPTAAVMAEEEGSVEVVLKVDAKGDLADCVVITSSGSAALDAQTCRLFWLRAKFEPARDASGKAVAGAFSQRITWRLEGGPPSEEWTMHFVLQLRPDGKADCRIELSGALRDKDETSQRTRRPVPASLCEQMVTHGLPDGAGHLAKQADYTVTLEKRFIPGTHADIPVPAGSQLVTRRVLHFSIAEDGRVSECREGAASGEFDPPPNACSEVPSGFEPPMGKDGKPAAKPGTIILSVYVNAISVS